MQPCADLNHAAHACAFAKNPNQALTSSQSEAACLCVLRYLCIMSMCSPTNVIPYVRNTSSAVSDADGDVVRCRWADSSLSECAGVCQTFPATLYEVGQT